jgi:hypothetical protein
MATPIAPSNASANGKGIFLSNVAMANPLAYANAEFRLFCAAAW